MRFLILFAFTIAACFGLQSLALRMVGGRTVKSESNFFSSVGRIQAGAAARPKIMVLGSSITGRLPDTAQGFRGISNMGCDGGNAIDALRAIDQGILPSAPWLVIEANTLHLSLVEETTEIASALRSPWFKLGIKYPLVSSYARPTAFFYSKLLANKIGTFDPQEAARGFETHTLPVITNSESGQIHGPAETKLIVEVSGIIKRLQSKGSKCIFVWLPPARAANTPPEWILTLAESCHSYWWDLATHIPTGSVKFTDRVHMDATSATRATGDLLRAVQQLEADSILPNQF